MKAILTGAVDEALAPEIEGSGQGTIVAEPRVVTIPDVMDSPRIAFPPGGEAASLGTPPSPGGGLSNRETRLPSGNPLSTRTRAEEGPWGRVIPWGGGAYPSELLPDSDLRR